MDVTMAVIIYNAGEGEDSSQYEIDELSQRMLVYLMTEGPAQIEEIRNPVGADANSEIQQRIDIKLGRSGAQFVTQTTSTQMTLEGEPVEKYSLTSAGEEFVFSHKATLSLPTTLGELSKKVSRLEVDLQELSTMVDELREQV